MCAPILRSDAFAHSERKAQSFLAGELEQWADDVQVENFNVHPHAFMGWIPAAGVVAMLSVLFYWLTFSRRGARGCAGGDCAVAYRFGGDLFGGEFLLYRECIDPLFPKKTSRNVMAVRKPSGEVRRRIIFGGHTDAANEWTYSLHGGLKSLALVMAGSIGGLLFVTVLT